MHASDVKISLRFQPSMLRPKTYRNARWRCGVKGSKQCELIEEKRIYGESRGLGKARGLERQGKMNVHSRSMPFQFRGASSFSDLGTQRKSNYRCKPHLTLSNQRVPCIRGIQLTREAGCILAIEVWHLSSLCFVLLFFFSSSLFLHSFILTVWLPCSYYTSSSI